MFFSVIVPVFNRPGEVEELLLSLSKQTQKKFEIVIVEDGSTEKCDKVAEKYSDKLKIKYLYKKNEKPAIARNYGSKQAEGDYLVFFDSDCIIPPEYFEIVNSALKKKYTDAYGGPDAASPDFSNLQKAINYSMTSFFTTGGIRGSSEKLDKFYPRSFNMGISEKAFKTTGGFPETKMHPGEDMIFSIEILKHGFNTQRIEKAFVYHKRRNTLKTFFKQVFNFGKTRLIISKIYPETFKIFFYAPSFFTIGTLLLLISAFFCIYSLIPILLFATIIFSDSLIKNKNILAALLAVITSFYQLIAYGTGFIISFLRVNILKKDEYNVLTKKNH
ncbi:MAG: glycosyltransferase [Chlorobi bacterium]|nr:glycosyltransferase [Chlorobiota bacterium]